MSEARRSIAPITSESTSRTIGLSAGQRREVHDLGVVLGHELEPQRLARLLEQHLAAAVALQHLGHPAPGRHHGVDGAAQVELGLVHLEQVLEPAERQHQPRARRPTGTQWKRTRRLERHLFQSRGSSGRRSRGSKGRRRASAAACGSRIRRDRSTALVVRLAGRYRLSLYPVMAAAPFPLGEPCGLAAS